MAFVTHLVNCAALGNLDRSRTCGQCWESIAVSRLYGGVVYRSLYPGIDMIYGADGRNLKSEFVVAPRADPSAIRVRYLGGGKLRIGEDGSLAIPAGAEEFREQAPGGIDHPRKRHAGE